MTNYASDAHTPEAHLADFFKARFKSAELRTFFSSHEETASLAHDLPGECVSHTELCFAAAQILVRHARIGASFFQNMLAERPNADSEIHTLSARFQIVVSSPSRTSRRASCMGQVFAASAGLADELLPRKLRLRNGTELEEMQLLNVAAPGLHLITGELGLGRSTALYRMGASALQRGRPFICLRGQAELLDRVEQGDRDWSAAEGEARRVGLVVWDDLPFNAESALGEALFERPDLQVIASCDLAVANALGVPGSRYRLLPLPDEDARALLERRGLPTALLDTWRVRLGSVADDLLGNPLFIALAAELGDDALAPQLTQLVAALIKRALAGVEGADALRRLMVGLSEQDLSRPDQPFSRTEALAVSVREAVGGELRLDDALRLMISGGVLIETQPDWYAFRSPVFPSVIAAHDRAQRRDLRLAAECPEGPARQCALLVPAFTDPALPALDLVAPHLDDLWLRGLAELAHERLDPLALGRAFARFIPFEHPERLLVSIMALFEAPEMMGSAKAVGLLRGLVHLRSDDPDLLGVLLMVIDHWYAAGLRAAEPLREELLRGFPVRPQRGPSTPISMEGELVWMADQAVTWNAFQDHFPRHGRFAWKGEREGRPKTGLRWPAARLYAALAGGRLPTRREWMTAMAAMGWTDQPRTARRTVAHLPSTTRKLSADGPCPVHDPRLSDDPGFGRVEQLVGNVREWTDDGPAEPLVRRWTLGGSYKCEFGVEESLGWYDHRVDVGLRLCWGQPPDK